MRASLALVLLLFGACAVTTHDESVASVSAPAVLEGPVSQPHASPLSVHIHRPSRSLILLDDQGRAVHRESIGVGRGGLQAKSHMGDHVTPTGRFTVDLILSDQESFNAVSVEAIQRFSDDPEYARLLDGDLGLAGLFDRMNAIDFDADGLPDRAYGSAYIGLDSKTAVTGPKMRRFSGTPYWFSIALHGTPDTSNLGAANSGGCVHLSSSLLHRLVSGGTVRIGSSVQISDELP